MPAYDSTIPELLESVIAASIERLIGMRDRSPGFAVLDDESLTELVTLFQTIEAKASLYILDAQVARIRQEREEAPEADHGKPDETAIKETFARLNEIEDQLRDALDNFPLPPDQTEPKHAQ